jgi:hypothetical protein
MRERFRRSVALCKVPYGEDYSPAAVSGSSFYAVLRRFRVISADDLWIGGA